MVRFDALGPEVVVVEMPVKSAHTDAYGVLCAGYVAVAFGVVFKTEEQARHHLLVVVRQLVWPYFFCRIACGCAHAAAFHELYCRLDAHGECPSGSVAAHVWLVDPSARKVYAIGQMRCHAFAQRCGAASFESGVGYALELDVFYAAFGTELALGVGSAVGVDHKDVRFDAVDCFHEIHHA